MNGRKRYRATLERHAIRQAAISTAAVIHTFGWLSCADLFGRRKNPDNLLRSGI